MNLTPQQLLESVPDLADWKDAERWLKSCPEIVSCEQFMSLEWNDIEEHVQSSFGLHASEHWRKFVLSTFAADLISYPKLSDQVDFARLLYVMHAFPKGFRVWWVKADDGSWWPVGYTGWYPMLDYQFAIFEKSPELIKDRTVVPNVHRPANPFLYLFSYSVAPALKKTLLSRTLIKRFVDDIHAQDFGGLACITVSEEGASVAKKFGMTYAGNEVYALRV